MDIEDLLRGLCALKKGSDELAIFYFPNIENSWVLHLGNPCSSVFLGESEGEFVVRGDSLFGVIEEMEMSLRRAQ
jgi:hypothetical protein